MMPIDRLHLDRLVHRYIPVLRYKRTGVQTILPVLQAKEGGVGTLSLRGFLVCPLRGQVEGGNQGAPLQPRQGPRPWTPLRGRVEEGNQGAPSHCPPDGVHLQPRQGRGPWTRCTYLPG